MFGWRARLGLLLPMDNAVAEPEWNPVLPQGVAAHVARLTSRERTAMPANGVELAVGFDELVVDVVGYGCAETSFLDGADVNRWIVEQIEARIGVPAVTTSYAMLDALTALEVHRIAVCSPYPRAANQALTAFLESAGFEVVGFAAQDLVSPEGRRREWDRTNRQPPSTAANLARRADQPSADAVLISGTNFRTFDVLPTLEEDLGKPVVSSNSALLWSMLRVGGVVDHVRSLGTLGTRAAHGESIAIPA